MAYIPHTDEERAAMLAMVGVQELEDMFRDIPREVRFPDLDLPQPLSEMEVMEELRALSEANLETLHSTCFLGAGAYNHFIPSAVDHILRRNEFYTSYTPYQPELSQGALQAIFEYQSLICDLTGMEVCNASHYDGATALAEAVIMGLYQFRKKRRRFILSPAIHPQYRQVVRTYMQGHDLQIIGDGNLTHDAAALAGLLDQDTALVAVQYPDFFGRVEDFTTLGEAAHAVGALLCVVVNPMALGLLEPPSAFGADIVVGDGQPLGIPMSYGGPSLGIFATREKYVRKISGRIVGETIDNRGQRGYVLTLTPREQHIRRERATSNICTNQGLMTVAAAAYLSLMGRQGLRQVAELCYHKAHYAAAKISSLEGFSLWSEGTFFHEFVVSCPVPVEEINRHLLEHDILGGYNLGGDYPDLPRHMLIAVTEMNSREDIDDLVSVMQEVGHG